MPQKKSSNGSAAIAKYRVTVTHREESEVVSRMRSQVIAKIAVDAATRKKLAEYLRLRRQELGLTQKQAGKLAEPSIDGAMVTNVERTGRVGHDLLMRYAKALDFQIPEDLMPQPKMGTLKGSGKARIRSVTLGRFLTKRRKELGLSRVDIANALGTHWTPIYQWEKALRPIADHYLNAWAEVLKCNPADLRALATDQDDMVTRVIVLKREDSEYLDFLLKLGKTPDSSRVVRESCKFLYSFLLTKALKRQSWNPHLFVK
jgi:transcriptional regulator with XRE-family HTH domain